MVSQTISRATPFSWTDEALNLFPESRRPYEEVRAVLLLAGSLRCTGVKAVIDTLLEAGAAGTLEPPLTPEQSRYLRTAEWQIRLDGQEKRRDVFHFNDATASKVLAEILMHGDGAQIG